MPRGQIAHIRVAADALLRAAYELLADGTVETLEEAVRIAAATLDGAGEGVTVESMQTCRDLGGNKVAGLTTDDSVTFRVDPFGETESFRAEEAEQGVDDAEKWLREHDSNYAKKKGGGWRR